MRTRKNLKQTQDKLLSLLDEVAAGLSAETQESIMKAKTIKRKSKIAVSKLIEMPERKE